MLESESLKMNMKPLVGFEIAKILEYVNLVKFQRNLTIDLVGNATFLVKHGYEIGIRDETLQFILTPSTH